MYYRENGKPIKEKYVEPLTKSKAQPLRTTKGGEKGTTFPLWLLLTIIAIILAVGLGLLYMLRKKKTGQSFGFRFY